ncbi:sulfite exporter TauE/SafE family protein [Shewanella zhangzhouensis]|uniref:sulfite exporter TauE/SafE family protein n=1 Tax=Shewanella zhangzhouensis TaxID=2864213 RepID=UPI001C658528|nr:sulfite exporter TauE/SafE family protein [Shewanella zhangzhouensis]QYK07160.1 sulfite exporter TauE/SafE family protein [Shewanella zhangzhouensis]
MMDYSLSGAFLVGLMGGVHCFGMCGGLLGAFSSQIPAPARHDNPLAHRLGFLLSYNGGRIASYTLAGAIAGGATGGLSLLFDAGHLTLFLRFLAGIMMILLGLYVAKIWSGVVFIETLGKGLWRVIQPFGKRLLPIDTRAKAILAGSVWGWLPCGLVYSTLTWSVASANPLDGALIMLFFGLGTLPALLSVGVAAKSLMGWLQRRAVRWLSGALLMAFGVQTLYIGVAQLG